MLIFILIIYYTPTYSQYDKRFEPLEINYTLSEIFTWAKVLPDFTFTQTDTVYVYDKHEEQTQGVSEKIMVLIDFVNGIKVRATGYYDNGAVYRESHFNSTGMNGMDWAYYKNGQLFFFQAYKNNGYVLPFFSFYPNGHLKYYVDMKLAVQKKWYENGKLEMISDSIDNCYKETWYYENGQESVIMYLVAKSSLT